MKAILKCVWGLETYIYIMFRSSVDQYTDLGRPGDTFAVAGDREM